HTTTQDFQQVKHLCLKSLQYHPVLTTSHHPIMALTLQYLMPSITSSHHMTMMSYLDFTSSSSTSLLLHVFIILTCHQSCRLLSIIVHDRRTPPSSSTMTSSSSSITDLVVTHHDLIFLVIVVLHRRPPPSSSAMATSFPSSIIDATTIHLHHLRPSISPLASTDMALTS
ncbi:hypothetical protein CC80DRAFT_573030, partial [Byssothecium circinans]